MNCFSFHNPSGIPFGLHEMPPYGVINQLLSTEICISSVRAMFVFCLTTYPVVFLSGAMSISVKEYPKLSKVKNAKAVSLFSSN